MCITHNFPKGVMNLDGDFNEIAGTISKYFEENRFIEVEFVKESKFKPGHSCLVVGCGDKSDGFSLYSLYIYDDGTVCPNILDDGVS